VELFNLIFIHQTTHPSAYTPFGPYPERKTPVPPGWVKFSSPIVPGAPVAAASMSAGDLATDASEVYYLHRNTTSMSDCHSERTCGTSCSSAVVD